MNTVKTYIGNHGDVNLVSESRYIFSDQWGMTMLKAGSWGERTSMPHLQEKWYVEVHEHAYKRLDEDTRADSFADVQGVLKHWGIDPEHAHEWEEGREKLRILRLMALSDYEGTDVEDMKTFDTRHELERFLMDYGVPKEDIR